MQPLDPAVLAAERAALIEQGHARGLEEGMRQGRAAAQAELTHALALLGEATTQMHDIASLAPAILEENVTALAITIARQILAREVSVAKELVTDLVRRALAEFPIDQPVRIRVNPVDLSVLTAAGASSEVARITGNRDASWLADPRVSRGGCLLEGRERIVDGRVDTALERVYRRITKTDAT
jgi:flagellar assembly protein FliH